MSKILALLTQHPFILGFVITSATLSLYIKTLAPSITWVNFSSDSGELASAVHTLGVAHPPGYPTYIVIGKVFSLLPFGELAFRTNIMSAFFGAVTVGMTFLIVLDLIALTNRDTNLRNRPVPMAIAAISSLALASAPIFWARASITEVYTLNSFFATSIILLILRRALDPSLPSSRPFADKRLFAAAFLMGIGLGNHLTLAALIPPALLLIAIRWNYKSFITLLPTIACLGIGLLIYVYMPISASHNPDVNWGQANEASGFWWMISGTPYHPFAFGASSGMWLSRLRDWSILPVQEFSYLGAALGLIGLWSLWRRHILIGMFTLSYVLILIIYAGTYATKDAEIYLIPGFVIYCLWIGLGFHWTIQKINTMIQKLPWVKLNNGLGKATISIVIVGAFLIIPLSSVIFNYADQDNSDKTAAREYGEVILGELEPGSLLFAELDPHIFSLWYNQFVQGLGPEVFVITQNLLPYDWYTNSIRKRYPGLIPPDTNAANEDRLRKTVLFNLERRPIYFTDETTANTYLFDDIKANTITFNEKGDINLLEVQP